jgi:hypothetical protein
MNAPISTIPIFVSHSSEDKSVVRPLARYLERRGWRVWIDEEGIAAGKAWHGALIQALEATWAVVLVVSCHSMLSRWVIREIQAADRLGKQIIPLVIDDAPYPDELRMILSSVQRLDFTERTDADRRNRQLSRLDGALIRAAQTHRRTPPGRALIAAGRVVTAIGVVGLVLGFALFAYLGYSAASAAPFGGGSGSPVYGWGVFMASMVVTGIGESMRRAGLKRGI